MNIFTLGGGFIASHLPYPKILDRIHPRYLRVNELIELYKPDCIINTIGYCGENTIDDCVADGNRRHKTYNSNLIIPTMLAQECEFLGVRLIHIGSGCIFNGESKHISVSLDGPRDNGWQETDPANPVSFYSRTKYACDLAIGSLSNVCVLRIRMPVSSKRSPRNLINKLINYKRVVEEPNSMTFMADLVRAVDWFIANDKRGIYHIAHPQAIKHSEILDEYRKHNPDHRYEQITVDELNGIVKEPRSNCLLDVSKAMNEGFEYGNAHEQISECVRRFSIGDYNE